EAGESEAVLKPVSPVGGVCRITVFEVRPTGAEQRRLVPCAERLVYRHPGKRVDLSIKPGKKWYAPGEKATATIVATDENEKPVPAMAQVSIVDQGVRGLADERTFRTGPTFFLLTSEVRRADDLERADFLLGQHPKAGLVLDHLLGTQGWRRFAEQDPERFRRNLREEGREEGERLLVMIGQSEPRVTDFDEDKRAEARARYDEEEAAQLVRHAEAAEAVERAAGDKAYLAALATMKGYDRFLTQARTAALGVLLVLGCLGLLAAMIQIERKKAGWAWASGAAGLVSAALLVWLARMPVGPSAEPMAPMEVAQLVLDEAKEPPVEGGARPEEEKAAKPKDAPKDDRGGEGGFGGGGGPVPAPFPGKPGTGGFGIMGGPPRMPGGALAPPGAGFGIGRFPSRPAASALAKKQAEDAERLKAGLSEGRGAFRADLFAEENARIRATRFHAPGRGGRGLAPDGKKKRLEREGKELFFSSQPLVFREYAHARPEGLDATIRADFAETVYWHPVLVLADGKAEASFQLPDSVTRFAASVFAHTLDGRLGAATKLIDSRLPLAASPKLPVEVTEGDRILAPVSVASTVADKLAAKLTVKGHENFHLEGEATRDLGLAAEGSRRVLVGLKPSIKEGTATLDVEAKAGGVAGDTARQTVRVVPDGFPIERSSSDLLEKSATHKLDVPADLIAGSLSVKVEVYPSLLADLTKGLDGLLREPYGCFEQTSTTNYPNVLILDFLKASKQASPETEGRARELLKKGYKRLVSFECQDVETKSRRGYEWFGGTAPPHDALTAYGLMQFCDMARLQDVDAAMIARTRDYLLSLRDGKGGFRHSTAKYSFGGAPAHLMDAYIVWALARTGSDDLEKEQAALLEKAKATEDAYFLSLVALGLSERGKGRDAEALLKRVAAVQKADGQLDAETSITRSGGVDLRIETTSLAVMGWLKANKGAFGRNAHLGVKWLGTQRQGSGSFGSTQATILALKALLAHAEGAAKTREDAELAVYAGDAEVARAKVPADARGAISLSVPGPEKFLKPGTTAKLRVELTGAAAYPHTVAWSYRAVKPANEAAPLVHLATKLEKGAVKEGEPARLTVRVENRTGREQGMATAIVGIPAGLSLPENLEQLRTLCKPAPGGKPPVLGAFETKGRELVLYWRGLAKGEAVEVPVDLVARVPGTYRGPASRAYLYYDSRNKHWVDPLSVTVAPTE
ncbi:MAG: alpha-2-macroglobulin, partial [Gemmataceae bacterium]|nr:alpha-2-macroglobulin [Gemmataceae bacterium]